MSVQWSELAIAVELRKNVSRSISVESDAPGIAHLLLNVVDLVGEPSQVHFAQLLVLEFLDKCIGVLAIDVHLQPLDVALVVLDALAQHLDVVLEHSCLGLPLLIHFLTFLAIAFKLCFKGCELGQVLLLDLCVLYLNDAQLLFILLGSVPESRCELIGLLCVQMLLVIAIGLLLLADLVYLSLESFILHFGECNLVLKFHLSILDRMSVVEIVR